MTAAAGLSAQSFLTDMPSVTYTHCAKGVPSAALVLLESYTPKACLPLPFCCSSSNTFYASASHSSMNSCRYACMNSWRCFARFLPAPVFIIPCNIAKFAGSTAKENKAPAKLSAQRSATAPVSQETLLCVIQGTTIASVT